ncbi:Hypothetical Protein FCC1311_032362 [Hondaea fermentalgiana]|uniref:Uncharacterized protein n=1 Tax=Hondaea fermentalgiana TaxID=2315210 RepID=A0A2R5GEH2_9STRA|nr:Hypothetical Protein FCC1311_032362 [Hondaea fermentalgiana]|eukprot:GBG27013.1 Hypothetical Protein FCC1311_032362 [Hondaea fermentalgiana]
MPKARVAVTLPEVRADATPKERREAKLREYQERCEEASHRSPWQRLFFVAPKKNKQHQDSDQAASA